MNIHFTNSLMLPPTLEGFQFIDWIELFSLAEMSLSTGGKTQLKRLRSLVDVENVRSLVHKEPLNPLGNWSAEEAKNEGFTEQLAPPLARFASHLKAPTSSLPQFAAIFVEFFAWDAESFGQGNFVGNYFRAEMACRWSLALWRAGSDTRALADERELLERAGVLSFLEQNLQSFEGERASLLQQLRICYRENCDSPMGLMRAVSEWRLGAIDGILTGEWLGIDRLLATCAQMMICADWRRMSPERGLTSLRQMRAEEALGACTEVLL